MSFLPAGNKDFKTGRKEFLFVHAYPSLFSLCSGKLKLTSEIQTKETVQDETK
jgi:hypothetical protein